MFLPLWGIETVFGLGRRYKVYYTYTDNYDDDGSSYEYVEARNKEEAKVKAYDKIINWRGSYQHNIHITGAFLD